MDKNWIINDNVSDWMTPHPVPAIPGGVYNSSPTPEDGSLVVPGSTATISAHAVDNSGQGSNYVNITETIEGQNQNNPWPILKTQSFSGNTPNADVSASFQMPNIQNVLLSFDVYSNNGQKILSPNGIRRFCPSSPCVPYNSPGGNIRKWH